MKLVRDRLYNIYSRLTTRQNMEGIACILIGCGLILFPIIIRCILLEDNIGDYACINGFAVLSIIIFLAFKKEHMTSDKIMYIMYALAYCLFMLSTHDKHHGYVADFVCNCFIPVIMILYRFDEDRFETLCKKLLICFDIFIVILVIYAIEEKVTGGNILHYIDVMTDNAEIDRYVVFLQDGRFYGIWGHTLTNALIFNMFFILNDIYYHTLNKKYPKLIFFLVAILGVLLCASKTGIVVLLAYFLLSTYRDKKVMIMCLVAGAVVVLLGGANHVIDRFMNTPLTTGRVGVLKEVLARNELPFMWWKGYGMYSVFAPDYSWAKPAFEFPLLMYALDYGIIFSLIFLGGIYIYSSYHMLKNKRVLCWVGFSLIYAETNTYNGICLNNQDIFIWLCVFTMFMINISNMRNETVREKEIE